MRLPHSGLRYGLPELCSGFLELLVDELPESSCDRVAGQTCLGDQGDMIAVFHFQGAGCTLFFFEDLAKVLRRRLAAIGQITLGIDNEERRQSRPDMSNR